MVFRFSTDYKKVDYVDDFNYVLRTYSGLLFSQNNFSQSYRVYKVFRFSTELDFVKALYVMKYFFPYKKVFKIQLKQVRLKKETLRYVFITFFIDSHYKNQFFNFTKHLYLRARFKQTGMVVNCAESKLKLTFQNLGDLDLIISEIFDFYGWASPLEIEYSSPYNFMNIEISKFSFFVNET
jgi:hypothetical protein